MKLDVSCMRYLQKDDFRVLTAIEMGMRNHELVPLELIIQISKLRHGGSHKILSTLLRNKLVAHANNDYNGYRLSYLGYDILALRTLLAKGIITAVGSQIGVGKESDIFEAQNADSEEVVIKIHRLGRTSFRAVRRHRDYLGNKSKASWLYMSRLAASKEFAFMRALHAHGFPTPIPIEQNRHIVVMSRVHGFPMAQIKTGRMEGAERIFIICLNLLKRLAENGLIHCDFNEFNLMVNDLGDVTMIDFPQMVSTSHPNATELFQRDVKCLVKFFAMKMGYTAPDTLIPNLSDITQQSTQLDQEVRASGFSQKDDDLLIQYIYDHESDAIEESEGLNDVIEQEDESYEDREVDENIGDEQNQNNNMTNASILISKDKVDFDILKDIADINDEDLDGENNYCEVPDKLLIESMTPSQVISSSVDKLTKQSDANISDEETDDSDTDDVNAVTPLPDSTLDIVKRKVRK